MQRISQFYLCYLRGIKYYMYLRFSATQLDFPLYLVNLWLHTWWHGLIVHFIQNHSTVKIIIRKPQLPIYYWLGHFIKSFKVIISLPWKTLITLYLIGLKHIPRNLPWNIVFPCVPGTISFIQFKIMALLWNWHIWETRYAVVSVVMTE